MFSVKRHIPNAITTLNLACGTLGVVFAMQGRVDVAFALMLAAGVFDFCDGLTARLLGAYSPMGKELDSIADEVSFGVLPAIMLYKTMRSCTFSSSALCLVPLLIAVFAGLRLAHFNVDESQKTSFKGLAAPICALICGSLCYHVAAESTSVLALWCACDLFIPVVSIVLCVLLVCPLPCFSMKFSKDDSKVLKFKRVSFMAECMAVLIAVLVTRAELSLVILLSCLLYLIKNVGYALCRI